MGARGPRLATAVGPRGHVWSQGAHEGIKVAAGYGAEEPFGYLLAESSKIHLMISPSPGRRPAVALSGRDLHS
jgi:hypothetical protein